MALRACFQRGAVPERLPTQLEDCVMTGDRYIKSMLTIIAGCLLFQTVLALEKVVEARQTMATAIVGAPSGGQTRNQAQPVIIVGWDADAIAQAPPFPVTVANPVRLSFSGHESLPVTVNGIRKGEPWDSINTHVEPQDMSTPGLPRR
jgi:hypothetical protein